jgi:hypothetical protein
MRRRTRSPVAANTTAMLVVGALWIVLMRESLLFDSLLTLGLPIVMLLLSQTAASGFLDAPAPEGAAS